MPQYTPRGRVAPQSLKLDSLDRFSKIISTRVSISKIIFEFELFLYQRSPLRRHSLGDTLKGPTSLGRSPYSRT